MKAESSGPTGQQDSVLSQNGLAEATNEAGDAAAPAAAPAPAAAKYVAVPQYVAVPRSQHDYMASADGRLVYQLSQLPFVKAMVAPRILFYHQ
jgi:hypothetical protein